MNGSTRLFAIIAAILVIATSVVVIVRRNSNVNAPAPKPAVTNSKPTATNANEMALVDDKGNITLRFTEKESLELVNGLFEALRPERPENSYFTPFMKKKISWAYEGITSGRIKFEAVPSFAKNKDGSDNNRTLMSSAYTTAGQPMITLYIPRLMSLVRLQYKVLNGYNELVKSVFALILVHESVHLEKDITFFSKKHSPEESIAEEKRAWFRVNMEVVRPLRAKGKTIEIDWLRCDDVLRSCSDKIDCQAFTDFITGAETGSFGPRYR